MVVTTRVLKCELAFALVTHNLDITFLQQLDLNLHSPPAKFIYAHSLAGQALIYWLLLSLSSMNIPKSKRGN